LSWIIFFETETTHYNLKILISNTKPHLWTPPPLQEKGRKLEFLDDAVAATGPGWEFSGGLKYVEVDSGLTTLQSVSLISEDNPAFPVFGGMHYCDLLSPYRGVIHQLLNIIPKLWILVFLHVSTLTYVVKV
jgi:hypothetical protein